MYVHTMSKVAKKSRIIHMHLHVLPRYANDGVGLTWPRKEPSMPRLLELAAKLKI